MKSNGKKNTAKELDELERDLGVGEENNTVQTPAPKSKSEVPALVKKNAQKKQGKRYTPDFKKMIIKEKKGGATYAELFKKHGVYASQIITWEKKVSN